MARLAHPVAAPSPEPFPRASCPECGTPVGGIATTEPGVHEFVDCGHRVTSRLASIAAD